MWYHRLARTALALVPAWSAGACAPDAPTMPAAARTIAHRDAAPACATSDGASFVVVDSTLDAGDGYGVVMTVLAGARAIDDVAPCSATSWLMPRIDAAAVGPIVARAHAAGLRVAAYVSTTRDFDAGTALGIDVVAPLGRARITKPVAVDAR